MKLIAFIAWIITSFGFYHLGQSSQVLSPTTRAPASIKSINVIGQATDLVVGLDQKMIFKAKVDTGAESSSLHAFEIKVLSMKEHGRDIPYVSYKTKDDSHIITSHQKRVSKIDDVKSASGKAIRYYVKETIWFDGQAYNIDVNLVDRSDMTFKFLLGKNALTKMNHLVDPNMDVIVYENDGPRYVYKATGTNP